MNWMVTPLAVAAVAAGADGIMLEVHNDPKNAKCDGAQSITPAEFDTVMAHLKSVAGIAGKVL
jgi:3-deoxy-7-phosphoheptulonate synthase